MRLPNRPPACLGRPTQVYLTDLCDEQDAEAACERAVEQALAVGGPKRAPLPEALQASANLRISQCRPADAAAALARVVQHIAQAVEGGELEALPSHDFRTTTAKLLLEVGEAESACDVLEQLLLEVRPRMGRRSCCPRGREARPGPTSPCRAPARSPRCCAPACADLQADDEPELRYLAAVAAVRTGDAESAAGHTGWFKKQLQKPGCGDEVREWCALRRSSRPHAAMRAPPGYSRRAMIGDLCRSLSCTLGRALPLQWAARALVQGRFLRAGAARGG